MSKLVIIRGNSGSGKSSLAKKVQKYYGRGTLLVQQDVVRQDMLWVHDGENNESISLFEKLLEYAYNNNIIAIFEGVFASKWYGSLFEKAVSLYGKENIYAYYYDLSIDETIRRIKLRKNSFEFDEKTVREFWLDKDYLNMNEEKIFFDDTSLEEALDTIISDVGDFSLFQY
ncbi:MAG: hypothetical protein E7282_07780 [Lachnospiraceae bacterium]|nr:hypothetical protein [Lachnospiraceae bacterium]